MGGRNGEGKEEEPFLSIDFRYDEIERNRYKYEKVWFKIKRASA